MKCKLFNNFAMLIILASYVLLNATEAYVQGISKIELQQGVEPKYAFSFTTVVNSLTQEIFVILDENGSFQNIYNKLGASVLNNKKIKYEVKLENGINELISIEVLEN